MKNLSLILTVLLVAASMMSMPEVYSEEGLLFYPVNSVSSDIEIHEFDLGQTPYVYLYLPLPEQAYGIWFSDVDTDWSLGGSWIDDSDEMGFYRRDYHLTLTDGFNWSDPANVGTWNVAAVYGFYWYGSSEPFATGEGNAWFTIRDPNAVPEPVSMVLFLAGGATLVGRRLLRRK